jgi:hypothetical protein
MTDRLTLMSTLEAQASGRAKLAVLPFRSGALRRSDGMATRVDWQPTDVHRHFLDVLRAHARRLPHLSPLAGRGNRAGHSALTSPPTRA